MVRFFTYSAMIGTIFGIATMLGVLLLLWRVSSEIPGYDHLANYQPKILSRLYADDGDLLAEYAWQRRVFVPYEEVPLRLVQAFVAAEDRKFFKHGGLDIVSIARSAVVSVGRVARGQRPVGGSTITQQVARNFLLSQDLRIERKIKEALLALRLERALSKTQIMELYLNEIYMGIGSYGVSSAALNYFNKSLPELTLSEMAYLAALPKGPNNYHPDKNHKRAVERRNWVLSRMRALKYITPIQEYRARLEPLLYTPNTDRRQQIAPYFAEEVRRRVVKIHGGRALYGGGLNVRTTLNSDMQRAALTALREGILAYDRRHGWRGPVARLEEGVAWGDALKDLEPPIEMKNWEVAVVLALTDEYAGIGVKPSARALRPFQERAPSKDDDAQKYDIGIIPLSHLLWARTEEEDGTMGPAIKKPHDALAVGDIVYVERVFGKSYTPVPLIAKPKRAQQATPLAAPNAPDPETAESAEKPDPQSAGVSKETLKTSLAPIPVYTLRQFPQVNGALVAIEPHTGRTLALVGGFSFRLSEFNRATQAKRQPGSAFKPFVYAAALENKFTPSSRVLDAPFVAERVESDLLWKPANYNRSFEGLTTLRSGLEHSRNLMTLHLANAVGINPIVNYAKRFGLVENIRPELGVALGIEETSLLNITAAFGVFANGGRRVQPYLIERIQDRRGRAIYKHDRRHCWKCSAPEWNGQSEPELLETRDQIISAQTAYQIVSMLEGVVERGTGRRASIEGRPLAGKTGTTDEEYDAWFVGFSPNLVAGVFIGFDEPKSLGDRESGGRVAAPIFARFMEEALGDSPPVPFRIPPGISLIRVNAVTGLPSSSENEPSDMIWEAFKYGTQPEETAEITERALQAQQRLRAALRERERAMREKEKEKDEKARRKVTRRLTTQNAPADAEYDEESAITGTGGLY